jgi:hypothetical protein
MSSFVKSGLLFFLKNHFMAKLKTDLLKAPQTFSLNRSS